LKNTIIDKTLTYASETWILTKRDRKIKWSRYRPGVAQRVGRAIALFFHDPGTLPPGKTWYPLYRRLSGPQGRSG